MKIRVNSKYDLDQLKSKLKNPTKGDTYVLYNIWLDSNPHVCSEDYVNIVIAKVKKKHLYYYKNLTRYKIPIDELENIIVTGPIGTIEFYNQYEYQECIEKQKLEQS